MEAKHSQLENYKSDVFAEISKKTGVAEADVKKSIGSVRDK